MILGAHVPNDDPLAAASARGAECVQVFLSNPQSWKAPVSRRDAADLAADPLPIYVHAPYLINVASPNNKVRIPSRKILQQTCDAAAEIGAAGVVVHGGHVDADTDVTVGFENWRKALERVSSEVPILIENTAGGDHAMTRYVDTISTLWSYFEGLDVGFCYDTCHAHAAGEDVVDAIDAVRQVTGRIDLLHLNDSRDAPGSGRDRHAPLGQGEIPADALVAAVMRADAPVVCETPGDVDDHRADLAWLRERLPSTSA